MPDSRTDITWEREGKSQEIKPTIKPTFKRSDLKDPQFFEAHKTEIILAMREDRIIDDTPDGWRNGKWGKPFGGSK